MDDSRITRLAKHNADDLAMLVQAVGWNIPRDQIHLTLSTGQMVGCWRDGRLVASAGLYTYGTELASLGMVMVHPAFQRQGLGRTMVNRCLQETERTRTPVMLVATEQGFPLYQAVGFKAVGQIGRFERVGDDPSQSAHASPPSIGVAAEDAKDMVSMDARTYGAPRDRLYHALFRQNATGFVCRDASGVRGFALCVHRQQMLVVGPLVAESSDLAIAWVRDLTRRWNGRIRLDVPSEQTAFIAGLSQLKFRETMISPLMLRGADRLPGQRNRLYAIADPVFG
ncbi:N-acetyltransferase [Alicyclobacillus contaminans]|uniref:GNAT family N-acetyltransferase n=1 Tax=Alicyclobacillus contaminans TaxID=392016 RepID=UPI00040B1B6D|nr:GNAT family N-acetyltransferase [Alicyclobacillus contaminans]GMA52541.1 N-acetyltransferase [Alicyclobacillus contaminans]